MFPLPTITSSDTAAVLGSHTCMRAREHTCVRTHMHIHTFILDLWKKVASTVAVVVV